MARNIERGLSPSFMHDFQVGKLSQILAAVQWDDTLSLAIRDGYVNIYYRGGSLMRLQEQGAGVYAASFDVNYLNHGLPAPPPLTSARASGLPAVISHQAHAAAWVDCIPLLKSTMDMWFSQKPKLEREFQQLVERMNNGNYATDYFICDTEYANPNCPGLRLDMLAFHWPSKAGVRKQQTVRLAFLEMKFGDGAVSGNCGICAHLAGLHQYCAYLPQIATEMRTVFNQRAQLGLLRCFSDGQHAPAQVTVAALGEHPLYILLLADHDPASSILRGEVGQLSGMPAAGYFDIRVATANFMGYGLFDEAIYPLNDFLAHYPGRI